MGMQVSAKVITEIYNSLGLYQAVGDWICKPILLT